MKSRSTIVFVCLGAVTGALVLGSSLQGCQDNGTGGTGGGGANPSTTSTGTTNPSTTSTMSTTSSSTSSMNTTSSTSTGTSSYVDVTVEQITNAGAAGHVGEGTAVQLKGVVAMSHKFLISQSKNNSCLWGVFLSAPGLTETKEYSGILATSYGTNATVSDGGTKAFCPVPGKTGPAGDAFPDDLKPGDVFDVRGSTSYFNINIPAPGSCTDPGESMDKQWQISKINPGDVTKTGTAALPAPHALAAADLTTLASQSAQDFYDKWGGVKVRATNGTPEIVTPDGGPNAGMPGIVGNFGTITLTGSNVQIVDKIYYQGLLAQSDICHKTPVYANQSTTFTQIDGFVYLNFCTWSIAPDNRCVDYQPPSDDCAGNTCP